MARVVVPGYPHHVTQRGSRRQRTFFGDADYLNYLELLSEFKATAGVDIWAYCLMPNHVHAHLNAVNDDLVDISPMHERISDWRGYLLEKDEPGILDNIRALTKTGRPAGDDKFIAELEAATGRRLRRRKPGPNPP